MVVVAFQQHSAMTQEHRGSMLINSRHLRKVTNLARTGKQELRCKLLKLEKGRVSIAF